MFSKFPSFAPTSHLKRSITDKHPGKFQRHPDLILYEPSLPSASMAPKELNFITGNKNKLAEVQAILSATPVKLQNQALDLLEIQGTIEEVSKDKCRRAAEAVRSQHEQ